MLPLIVFLLISVVWLAAGAAMIAAPAWWCRWLVRALADPFSRFLILQGSALAGLLLLLAAAEPPRDWFWVAVGAAMTVKALVLLGLRDSPRNCLLQWWQARSAWWHRSSGFVAVALAVLLAIHGLGRG